MPAAGATDVASWPSDSRVLEKITAVICYKTVYKTVSSRLSWILQPELTHLPVAQTVCPSPAWWCRNTAEGNTSQHNETGLYHPEGRFRSDAIYSLKAM